MELTMKSNTVISIDPGINGAYYVEGTGVYDLPQEKPIGRNSKVKYTDFDALYKTLIGDAMSVYSRLHETERPSFTLILAVEQVHSSPQMGSSAAFNFGHNFACCKYVLLALKERMEPSIKVEVIELTPQKWKGVMGLSGKSKDASLNLAIELRPDLKEYFKLKKHTDRAEAMLIGYAAKNLFSKGLL